MMLAAFGLLIDHNRQVAIGGHVGQEVKGSVGTVASNQLLPEGTNIMAATGKHGLPYDPGFGQPEVTWVIPAIIGE
jgi:hypothetical protein